MTQRESGFDDDVSVADGGAAGVSAGAGAGADDVRDAALRDLRTIRRLMERATVYEALSAPGALLGGSLGMAAAAALYGMAPEFSGEVFLAVWVGVFLAAAACSAALRAREASARGESFWSPGLRLTLRAISPPLLAGFAIGAAQALGRGELAACASTWAVFYGLALLATARFAPRGMRVLGVVFTVFGGALAALLAAAPPLAPQTDRDLALAAMALGFGTVHFIYGIAAGRASVRQTAST